MADGKLIALEGIDGSGVTTQAELLRGWFLKRGLECFSTKEPSQGPIGSAIRLALAKRIVFGGPSAESTELGHRTLALMFAADRLDHLVNDVLPKLELGIHVVTDRYRLSSLAYQGLEMDVEWIAAINSAARKPDLTILIDTPSEIAQKRIQRQRWHVELYEQSERLEQVRNKYSELAHSLNLAGERVLVLDGREPLQSIHRSMVASVQQLLTRAPKAPEAQLSFVQPGS